MVDKISHFFGFPQPPGRDFLYQGNKFVIVHPLVHFCVNGTAGNSIDLDVAGSQFLCKSFGEGVDAALGSRVGHLAGCADDAPDRRNINDFSLLPGYHAGDS